MKVSRSINKISVDFIRSEVWLSIEALASLVFPCTFLPSVDFFLIFFLGLLFLQIMLTTLGVSMRDIIHFLTMSNRRRNVCIIFSNKSPCARSRHFNACD